MNQSINELTEYFQNGISAVDKETSSNEAIISCPYAGLGHCPEGQGPDTV